MNDAVWLRANGGERMDATKNIFNSLRAAFHLARYKFAAEKVSGLHVADIACGTGYGASIMKCNYTGVDINEKAIDYAKRTYGSLGSFYCADACKTPFLGNFDAVVSFETIEHVEDANATIREFTRITKPGGLLICSTPNAWPLTKYHVRSYTRDSFLDLVEDFYTNIKLYNQNSGSAWDKNHGQVAGIIETTDQNFHLAECFILTGNKI